MKSLRPTLMAMLAWFTISWPPLFAALEVGAPLPNLQEFGLEGPLPELQGKVVVVDFFASWCAPCLASFPALQELTKTYGPQGVVFLAVNVDKKKEDMERFLKRLKFTPQFAIVRDSQQKMVTAFSPENMPTSYVFDRQGKLHSIHAGFHGAKTREAFQSDFQQLLTP